jgi:Tol biopolymer transport system component
MYPHWSPDGTRVVFHSGRSGRHEIYTVTKEQGELAGETPKQLTFDGGTGARWSPDGRFIAYRNPTGVAVVPVTGGESRQLADFGYFPRWSKDGETIYFKRDQPDVHFGIWSVPVRGGQPKMLVRFDDPERQPLRPEWSTDGQNFYFTLTEFEADVWVMELEDPTK